MGKKQDVTTNEIMEFLQEHTVTHEELNKGLHGLRAEFKQDLNKQKLEILDEMDDKLADLKGDLVVMMRKEDKKVSALIELLKNKKVLSREEAGVLLDLRPFPQSV